MTIDSLAALQKLSESDKLSVNVLIWVIGLSMHGFHAKIVQKSCSLLHDFNHIYQYSWIFCEFRKCSKALAFCVYVNTFLYITCSWFFILSTCNVCNFSMVEVYLFILLYCYSEYTYPLPSGKSLHNSN